MTRRLAQAARAGWLRSGAEVFTLKVVGASLGIVVGVALGRLLGARGVGVYFLCFSVVSIGAVVSRFGLDIEMVRYVGASRSHLDLDVRRTVRQALVLSALFSVTVGLALFLASGWLQRALSGDAEFREFLGLMVVGMPFLSARVLLAGALRGLDAQRWASLVESVLTQLLLLLLLFPAVAQLGLLGAAVAFVLANFLTAIASWMAWMRLAPSRHPKGVVPALSDMLWAAFPVSTATWLSMVSRWADTLLLGAFVAVSDVGVYSAALRLGLLGSFVLNSVNSIVGPRAANAHAAGDLARLRMLAFAAAAIATAISIPVALVFFVIPGTVLSIFGTGFAHGAVALRVLAFGNLVSAACGSAGTLLVMTGHSKQLQKITSISVALGILVGVVLIREFGIVGAAIANAGAMAIRNVWAVWSLRVHAGVVSLPLRFTGAR